jgi:hypothetical protein
MVCRTGPTGIEPVSLGTCGVALVDSSATPARVIPAIVSAQALPGPVSTPAGIVVALCTDTRPCVVQGPSVRLAAGQAAIRARLVVVEATAPARIVVSVVRRPVADVLATLAGDVNILLGIAVKIVPAVAPRPHAISSVREKYDPNAVVTIVGELKGGGTVAQSRGPCSNNQ